MWRRKSAAAFPSWVLLEPFILRRDKAASFPNETKAPISFSGTTSCGDAFLLAFHLAEPPRISSLYAHDFFVFDASATNVARSLVHLPVCTEPPFDYSRLDGSLRRRRRRHRPRLEEPRRVDVPRLLAVRSMGLLSRGEQEFAVATLDVHMPKDILFADIFWMTDSVVPIGRWLCWIDYCRGILFCDVFAKPKPTVFYLRLPLDKFPKSNNRGRTCSWMNRRFVDVARSDDRGYKALKPGAGFTITCHTLMLGSVNEWDKETIGSVVWHKDWTVTSNELWLANPAELLPREVPTFPQVNIDKPHVVHFLVTEFGYVMKKMWVVAIDMSTSKVQSCSQYVNGRDEMTLELSGSS
ncbi:hypothetical protein PVAP13_1NG051600 [Panicum virgatum]|uniref:DUF1618 domain-containing protein n=1 Tax=Panicum virgatum TaxID=38727 RepID=A0A8T0WY02_PANVG|nr:hypothetical protein PVAP13_1NG051600 [Panicum virgatum]